MKHDELSAELLAKLTAAGINQYRLMRAGITTTAARRVLGKGGKPSAQTMDAAARLVGYELRLVKV